MIDKELLLENEIRVNEQSKKLIRVFAIIAIIGCLIVLLTDDSKYMKLDLANSAFLLFSFLLMLVISHFVRSDSSIYKYIFLFWLYLPIVVEVILTTDYFWPVFAIPMMLSCRYYNMRLVVIVSIFTQICLGIALVGISYIQPMFGYARAGSVYLPMGLEIIGDGRWLSEVAADFLQEGVIPMRQYLYTNLWGHVIYYIIIMLSISCCCLVITRHGIQLIEKQSNIMKEKNEMDVKLAESRYRILISQIQPHFIFNVLTSLITLCRKDPEKAQKMLQAFSAYLRYDIDILSNADLVPFEMELRCVEHYVALEQMRLGELLKVEMKIEERDFRIPPLTLQPLIENAIKHGIRKKKDGGTVWIRTRRQDDSVILEVEDNGAGFDPNTVLNTKENHVGLDNIRNRLGIKIGAELSIKSQIGIGTKAIIRIPETKINQK